MHNAFYVFTLQNERKRNPSLSRSRVVETYVLFKEVKKGQKAHTLHNKTHTHTQDKKQNASAKRKRDRFSKKR